MPLFINRDQIFAHQLHLLEHKLRSKEERILELETENALLHLRLAECLKKLRHESVKESHVQKWKLPVLSSLLSEVQVLKQDLRNILTSYMGFAGELQEQSRKLLQLTCTGRITDVDLQHSPDVQKLQTCVASLQEALQEEKDRCRQEKLRRRLLHNTLVELRGNIRVHCRLRPVLHLDHLPGSSTASEPPEAVLQAVSDDSVLVNCVRSFSPAPNKVFEFERVHGPEDDQAAVFAEVKPLLTSLLDGYNVCIMAYGQTGSGKTHTMIGTGPGSESESGIIPKAAGELFRLISQKPLDSHQVEMSVLEVYNNEILDLLARDESGSVEVKREVLTTSSGSSDVPGLTYQPVSSSADVMQVISSVLKLRSHSPTLVHMDSSRSHFIVTLSVTSRSPDALLVARRLQSSTQRVPQAKEWWSPRCRRAAASSPSSSPSHSPSHSPRPSLARTVLRTKLQLVDLAGSECVGVSGVSGAALWETSCINRSLSALSDVLAALAQHRPHVPYRNSTLTHLLQDAIGGDAKLLIMLCVSPAHHFLGESLQTLGFGSRARQIQRRNSKRK